MRPSNPPECLPLRRRPPRRFIAEAGALVSRGLAEARPRRLSYPKLAATAVRQMAFKSLSGVDGAVVLMPLAGADGDQTLSLLSDIPALALGAAVFPAFLDNLDAAALAGGRRIVAVLGDGEVPRGDAHGALARSLAAHNPQIEQRLAQVLNAGARASVPPAGIALDRLVVEERPGKAVALGLAETSLKLTAKRFQALSTRSPAEGRPPVETADGWGVGAMVIASATGPGSRAPGRALTVASLDSQLAGDAVNLDTGRQLRAVADGWLREAAGFGVPTLRRVTVSVPWMAVAAAIGAVFAPAGATAPLLQYPDLLHGWQPFMTMIEFLYGAELPALFVYTGRFPVVHLVAAW